MIKNSNIWGPPTWMFFHTIIEKIIDEHFEKIGKQLFIFIKKFCVVLNCNICSYHATQYFLKCPNINTKEELKLILFNLHNEVNEKKQKSIFKIEDLELYKKYDLNKVYKKFLLLYRPININLNARNIIKNNLCNKFDIWFKENSQFFLHL